MAVAVGLVSLRSLESPLMSFAAIVQLERLTSDAAFQR